MSAISLPAGRIAIVGMAKNCGKTTTLNRSLLALGPDETGIVSIGIDGETADVLIGTPKPPVTARPGMWVVTADKLLESSSAGWEWCEALGVETPLGEAVVARCLSPGEVVLGGLRHRADLALALNQMEALGAAQILVDGAYGRISAAAPDLTDAVIVSTGAIVSGDARTLADRTTAFLDLLMLPACRDEELLELGRVARGAGVSVIEHDERRFLPSPSPLLGLQRSADLWGEGLHRLALVGVLSDGVVDELLAARVEGRLLVADPTVIQCTAEQRRRLEQAWSLEVVAPVNVFAVALNPTSITGDRIDARIFAQHLHTTNPKVPVFNPMVGIHSIE